MSIEPTATVLDLKQKCEEPTSLKADQIRLIFKGRILKDADTLDKYNITNESAVHLVKSSAAASSAPQPAATTPETTTSSTGATGAPAAAAGAGGAGAAGAGLGGMGGFGGLGGMGGMGGMGGFPGMAAGGGLSGM